MANIPPGPFTDPGAEIRRKKQAATMKVLREHGHAAFRILHSAEASPISYRDVPIAELPRPASD